MLLAHPSGTVMFAPAYRGIAAVMLPLESTKRLTTNVHAGMHIAYS